MDRYDHIHYNGLRTKDTAPNERKVNKMKFTAKGYEDGWMDTVEDSKEFMENEIMWNVKHGAYEDVSEIIEEFSDYIKEFSPEEISQMEDAIAERLDELEELEEKRAEEEERLAIEWEQEIAYLNAEYLRSVRVA